MRRPVESAQYTSIDYTQTLDDHGLLASIGSVEVLLALNKGDNIVASGQIRKFEPSFSMEIVVVIVALDKCKVLDARAPAFKDSLP